jgi:limonene-1,2-epoxide hydrolase
MKIARRTLGLQTVDVEILHIASAGDVVHVARIDRLRRADGSLIAAAPVAGVLRFQDDQIVHWREYFDSTEFVAQTLATSCRHAVRRVGLFLATAARRHPNRP